MLDYLNNGHHFGHSVTHRRESDFIDLLLFKLLETITDIRLNLSAGIDTHDIIRNHFPFYGFLNNLIVFFHISLLNNYISQFRAGLSQFFFHTRVCQTNSCRWSGWSTICKHRGKLPCRCRRGLASRQGSLQSFFSGHRLLTFYCLF